eukprot:1523534-Pyramimonas_sp.AAC.2
MVRSRFQRVDSVVTVNCGPDRLHRMFTADSTIRSGNVRTSAGAIHAAAPRCARCRCRHRRGCG